jgi:2'-5' RNA ligase
MTDLRAFIAISLSSEVVQGLDGVLSDLKRRLPPGAVHWVQVRNIHLTLKFLGDVAPARLEAVNKALQNEAVRRAPFEVQVGGFGCFPSARRPRVLWVGVQAPEGLAVLQCGIEAEMARLGFTAEDWPFSPHLTLGRVGRNAGPDDVRRLGDLLSNVQVGPLGVFRAEAVYLYKSDLQPGGSVYTRLFTAPLSGF